MNQRRRLTKKERRAVYDKMGGHCAYCGREIAFEDMQIDHIKAICSGGDDDIDNMLPTCRSCNHYKRGNSLEGWRKMIEATASTLERDCYTYRQAVRFRQVMPTPKKVIFYFEKIGSESGPECGRVDFG